MMSKRKNNYIDSRYQTGCREFDRYLRTYRYLGIHLTIFSVYVMSTLYLNRLYSFSQVACFNCIQICIHVFKKGNLISCNTSNIHWDVIV